jgi:hypothetical protein
MKHHLVAIALILAGCGTEPAVSGPGAAQIETLARPALPRASTGDGLRVLTHWPIPEDSAHAGATIELAALFGAVTIEVATPDERTVSLRPGSARLEPAVVPVSRSSSALWLIEQEGLWLVPLADGPVIGPVPWRDAPADLLALPGEYRVSITGSLSLGDRALRFASPPVTVELAEAGPALRPLADLDRRARLAVATTHEQLDEGRAPLEITGGPADAVANPAGNRVLRYRTVDRAGAVRTWQVTIRPDGEVVGLEHAALPACAQTGSCPWQWDDPWHALYRRISAPTG